MGNTDTIPVISQAKSTVQLICGDGEGAAKTADNFLHECPIVSQGTSVFYLVRGDPDKALLTQKRCGKGLLNAADGIPIVGHAKGGIHYLVGDKEGGHRAMKSATRTTGVLGGGAAGFLLGGPLGAVAGGIYGGATTDLGTTVVTGTPSGYVAAVKNVVENPNPGDIFDMCLMPVADGLAGHSAGNFVNRLTTPRASAAGQQVVKTQVDLVKAGELKIQAEAIYNAAEANMNTGGVPEVQILTEMNKARDLWIKAEVLEGKMGAANPKVVPKGSFAGSDLKASVATTQKTTEADEQKRKKQRQIERQRQEELLRKSTEHKHAFRQRQSQGERDIDSNSSSESDDECSCREISIPVIYSNIGSMNPTNHSLDDKINKLRELIKRNNPVIIAVVETWLRAKHSDAEVCAKLGLDGRFQILRQDRDAGHPEDNAYAATETGLEGKRGGGILIAWRSEKQLPNGSVLLVKRNPSEDFGDSIMSMDIHLSLNCGNCNDRTRKKFGFTVVYRRPRRDGNDFDVRERLTHMPAAYEDHLNNYSGWSFVGDFNFRGGGHDPQFRNLLGFAPEGTGVFPETPTHSRNGCLDLVVASPGHVSSVLVTPNLISDHKALIYFLKLGKDYPQNEKCEECSQ